MVPRSVVLLEECEGVMVIARLSSWSQWLPPPSYPRSLSNNRHLPGSTLPTAFAAALRSDIKLVPLVGTENISLRMAPSASCTYSSISFSEATSTSGRSLSGSPIARSRRT